jgi:hypothetical protein
MLLFIKRFLNIVPNSLAGLGSGKIIIPGDEKSIICCGILSIQAL